MFEKRLCYHLMDLANKCRGSVPYGCTTFMGKECISFRGTSTWYEVVDDLKVSKTRSPFTSGNVHTGFLDAYLKVKETMDGEETSTRRVTVAGGYSLGAAISILYAADYDTVKDLYLFGSPRVGDESFTQDFEERMKQRGGTILRLQNKNDIVTRLPPRPFYSHVGKKIRIDFEKGSVIQNHYLPNYMHVFRSENLLYPWS